MLLALFLRLVVAVVFVVVRDLPAVSGCSSEFRTVPPNWSCWLQFVPVLGLVWSARRQICIILRPFQSRNITFFMPRKVKGTEFFDST